MQSHAPTCLGRCCDLAHKTADIYYKNYTHHAWMTTDRHQEEYCEIFGMPNLCAKFMDMSCSSTEAEVSFLDAGLRLGGLFALSLRDIVIDVVLQLIVNSARCARSRQLKSNTSKTTQEPLIMSHLTHQHPAIVLICFFSRKAKTYVMFLECIVLI